MVGGCFASTIPELGPIRGGLADGRVMQLEDDVRPLRHEFRRAADVETLRAQAGVEFAQNIVAVGAVILPPASRPS